MPRSIDASNTTRAERGDVKSRLAAVRKRCDALRDRQAPSADELWPRDLNASGADQRDRGDAPAEATGE